MGLFAAASSKREAGQPPPPSLRPARPSRSGSPPPVAARPAVAASARSRGGSGAFRAKHAGPATAAPSNPTPVASMAAANAARDNAGFQPLPPLAAERFAVAPELEAGIDDLWTHIAPLDAAAVDETTGRVLLVAHWTPGEGGTTVAAALACRAAEIEPERSFCLVDFDFFNPGLTCLTGLESEAGVCNVLAGRDAIEAALAPTGIGNLTVMPIGHPNLGRRVHSLMDRCRHLVGLLRARFHYVVIDLPQLAAWSRVSVWAGGLGQAVLVVRVGQAQRATVAKSLRLLRRLRLDVAGIVLNGQDPETRGWARDADEVDHDEWAALDLAR